METTNQTQTSRNGNTLEDMSGVTVIDMGTDRLGNELEWHIEEETGYKPQTTFWQDFAIADIFGERAIIDTVVRAARDWHDNAVYITELSLVLNHRGWMHYHAKRKQYADLYFSAWEWLTGKIVNEWLTGDDLAYYYETTD